MKKIALFLFVLITLGTAECFAWNGVKIGKVSSDAECEDLCYQRYPGNDFASQWRTEPSADPSKMWCYCRSMWD